MSVPSGDGPSVDMDDMDGMEDMEDMDGMEDMEDVDNLEPVEMTEEQMQSLMELEQSLQDNPMDYDAHVRYVALLRACRLREKLREARSALQQAYPMTENMWLEWVEDESEALETMEDVARLEALLERSHGDYLSVSLWKEHAEVSIAKFEQRKAKGEAEGAAAGAVRSVFDEALADCGLHVVEGATLWNMCLDFELQNVREAARDEARIEQLFKKFLACPFPPDVLMEARARYMAWLRGGDDGDRRRDEDRDGSQEEKDTHEGDEANRVQPRPDEGQGDALPRALEKSIERAMRAYELRRGHEEAIVTARNMDPQGIALLSVYASYLEMEASSGAGSEGRVRTIFERAIVEFPTSDYLWTSYIDWVDANTDGSVTSSGENQSTDQPVPVLVSRALRNCPWSGDVWARHFETLDDTVDAATEFERCRRSLAGSAAEFQKAVVAYIRCSVFDKTREDLAGAQEMEGLLRECLRLLKEQGVVDPDHRCAWLLSSMLAKCHEGGGENPTDLKKDITAGLAIWEDLVAEGKLDSQYSGTWMSYYDYLVRIGADAAAKREIFQRAVTTHMADAEKAYVARAWLLFEEREGSHEKLRLARRKTLDVMRRTEAVQRGISLELGQITGMLAEVERKKRRQQNDPNFIAGGSKMGTGSQKAEKQAKKGSKRQKKAKGNTHPKGERVAKKKHDGVAARPAVHGERGDTEPAIPSSDRENRIGAVSSDDGRVAVFIKYIDASVTENELATELAPCGSDMVISLARDPKSGRSKGFAYVTCSKETSDKLCGLNGKEFKGKRLLIAPSDPTKATKRGNREQARKGDRKGDDSRHSKRHALNQPKQSQRTKLGGTSATMLVPRSAVKATTNVAGSTAAPKSNDEFRKMFMKS